MTAKHKRTVETTKTASDDVPEEESISIDLEDAGPEDNDAGGIEMAGMSKLQRHRTASMSKLLDDNQHGHLDDFDPFEIEQINAMKRRDERRRKRRQKRLAEKEEKKHDETLEDLWGDTEDLPTASKMESVGRVAKTYVTGDEESSDDEAAERELGDGGAKVISQSVAMTMEAVLDMAFGGSGSESDEDSMAGQLLHVEMLDDNLTPMVSPSHGDSMTNSDPLNLESSR